MSSFAGNYSTLNFSVFICVADGSTDFQPEKGRYHLYHQYMCPFSHRVLLARTLKGLEDVISCDNMDYVLEQATGWKFSGEVYD